MNHSSAENPLFVNSSASTSNAYRSWYVWQAVAPTGWSIYGSNPWKTVAGGSYFAAFWDQMPDFNLKSQTVIDYHKDNLRFWLNRGADGFRFDAAGVLIENGANAWNNQTDNHPVLVQAQAVINSYGNRYMICEAPDAPLDYAKENSCGNAFAFGYQSAIKNAVYAIGACIYSY